MTSAPLKTVSDLPDGVRENVLALQHLQEKYQTEFVRFLKEREAVYDKYDKLYQPLYLKRREIVTGTREPTEEEVKKGEEITKKQEDEMQEKSGVEEIEDEEEDKEKAPQEDAEAGIPNFWLTALQNQDSTSELVEDKDEQILAHLIDISCTTFNKEEEKKAAEPDNDKEKDKEEDAEDDDETTGFTLTFEFSKNPFFTNEKLTKTYYTKLDDEDGEDLLVKGVGCDINWEPNMNPTVKVKSKKQVKGQKTRVVKTEEAVESFFNFFKPPYADDSQLTKEVAELMEDDFMVGCEIRKMIIPRAVAWYTGEAAAMDFGDLAGLGGDDEEDEEADEDEEKPDCKQQ